MKTTLYPKGINAEEKRCLQESSARITVQMRQYDERGGYDKNQDRANATIHLKGFTLAQANVLLQQSLLNNNRFDENFDVELSS